MTSIRKALRVLAAAALVGAGFVATSEASTISVVPGSQTIGIGDTATVDVVLSGLLPSETVGGYSFLLTFNNAIVGAPIVYQDDPDAKMGPSPLFLTSFVSPNKFDDLVSADALITEPALKALQGTGFVLARMKITGLTEGLSPITLGLSPTTGVFLTDFDGDTIAPTSITVLNGSICVDDPQTPGDRCGAVAAVPEPATLSLLGAGLAAAVARRRRKASKA